MHGYIIILYQGLRRERKMTKAEKKALEARIKDLQKAGVEKELAKVMAKVELECGLIKTVVNY